MDEWAEGGTNRHSIIMALSHDDQDGTHLNSSRRSGDKRKTEEPSSKAFAVRKLRHVYDITDFLVRLIPYTGNKESYVSMMITAPLE